MFRYDTLANTTNMKAYVLCLALFCFYAVNSQPTSESVWDALDAKVAAINITNFYFLLGNEDGVFYTYQKGKQKLNYLFRD